MYVDVNPNEIEETELLICSPIVWGAGPSKEFPSQLSIHKGDILLIDSGPVGRDQWQCEAYPSLKMSKTQRGKRISGHFAALSPYISVTRCMLLVCNNSGPLGVGKSLQAETIAETPRVPPYTVRVE
jgi:hypothetical protein